MRRVLVFEPEPAARLLITETCFSRACQPILYDDPIRARAAWAAGKFTEHGHAYHVVIIDGRPCDEGFDLARYVRETNRAVALIVTVDNPDVTTQTCDALGAACVDRRELRRGLKRELGFEGTLPAGLAGKPR